jgi:predicted CXXCH cytochrome family protein
MPLMEDQAIRKVHTIKNGRGTKMSFASNRCHFPKRGKGLKIWDELPLGAETISGTKGMRTICQSCHYPGNAVNALSGFSLDSHPMGGHLFENSNVFIDQTDFRQGEDHVMHDWANTDPSTGKLPKELDPVFPLKKKDKWGHPEKKGDTDNKGFFCGSCHDPHEQPEKNTDGTGDYLRIKEGGDIGKSGDRTNFCLQCHQNLPEHPQHGVHLGCQKCHNPHDGIIRIEDDPVLGQWIHTNAIKRTNFRAFPNVSSFGSQDDGIDIDVSSICYGCHNPDQQSEIFQLGIGVIYADETETPREHHPMGFQAIIEGMTHATVVDYPSPEGQLTCISCHEGFHEGKNPYFLREDFTEDNADFCSMCHSDKAAEDLGPIKGKAHRQVFGKSPNGRGNCMFCHYIHDGEDQGTSLTPGQEAIIRISPLNLNWAGKGDDQDTEDYEDLCFGCHGNTEYMNGSGLDGAKLQPQKFASHPFSGSPKLASPKEGFLISDGSRSGIINDYGVPPGEIFCGSCHNIHKASNKPYLRVETSPYTGQGFCEGCHTENPGGGLSSHPVGVSPNLDKTLPEFPEPLFGGGSGEAKGLTKGNTAKGEILCLTCHNMHAALTDHNGNLLGEIDQIFKRGRHGPLLLVDNFSSETGSDLCRLCHKPFETICESMHDFSSLDLGEISSHGICSACHTPHRTKDKQLLWPRSLEEERNKFFQADKPNYIIGATIFCYDCHEDYSSTDNDPPSNVFFNPPQDIAFTDGPGISTQVGYYETIPPENDRPPVDGSPTGGHYIKKAQISKLRHGIETGDKIPCDLCHDPHARNENQVFLVNPLGVNTIDNLEASRYSRNGSGTGREICAACHGYAEKDAMIGIPVKIYDFYVVRTSENREEHKKGNDTPCKDCHRHNRIVPVQNLAHLVHLISPTEPTENSKKLIRAKGMTDPGRGIGISSCSICHYPELAYNVGELTFEDDQPINSTGVCQPCHSQGGSYDGVSDPLIGAKNNWQTSPYNSNGTLKLGKEKWCAGCHDEDPSVVWWPGLGRAVSAPIICGQAPDPNNQSQGYGFFQTGHGLPPYLENPNSGRRGAGLICTDCHDPDMPHVMIKRYNAEEGNYQSGYRLRSVNGKEPMILPRWRNEYWSGDFNLCYSCHVEESIIGIGFGYRYYTTNHNPFFLVDNVETAFKNVDLLGLNRHNISRGPTFDFINYYPSNSHWNHLALPDAPVTLSLSTGGGRTRVNRCIDSRCHSKIVWDSDCDGWLDSRPSCPACHNPHGTKYTAMTRDDLAITHDKSGSDWTYGYIGSPNYGIFDNEGEDLYCGECHAQLMRFGESNYKYYRKSWDAGDEISPGSPE